MKKLKLELDTLRVQSFATVAGVRGERGTVRGHYDPHMAAAVTIAPIVSTDQMDCMMSLDNCTLTN